MELALRDVVKTFGSFRALDGVSLSIPSGQKVALIGPNGSGKSTLTRILMGMSAFEGQALLDGLSPLEKRMSLARRMAYVPQNPPRLAASVADVVEAVATIREIDPTQVGETASRLDLNLEALSDRPVRDLSAGMKQKLMIALALSGRADLLILDEPTASLDAQARARFFELFAERAEAATLILCSHRLEEIQYLVEHVVALDAGKVVFDGPVGDFLAARAVSMVEIATTADHHADWLRDRGFRPATASSWARAVARSEKLSLLREIANRFNGDLDNIVIRDVETVALEASEPLEARS